jgi:hypothetical protein
MLTREKKIGAERFVTSTSTADMTPNYGRAGVASSGSVAVVQDAAPQSGAQQGVPIPGSVPAFAPPSSAAVIVAELWTPGGRKLWKILVPTAALVVVLGEIFAWLSRPLPPPKVLKTSQITHDGVTKTNLLTDGSRLCITESTGPTKQFLVQGSVTGGDTSVVPTPFSNPVISDISPDHSQLLVADNAFLENEARHGYCLCRQAAPAIFRILSLTGLCGLQTVGNSHLPKGLTFSWLTQMERTPEN